MPPDPPPTDAEIDEAIHQLGLAYDDLAQARVSGRNRPEAERRVQAEVIELRNVIQRLRATP